jgi:hypothetical protein
MSRSALGVTSDILGLKILVSDAVKSLRNGEELAPTRRQSLSNCFHRYIQSDSLHRLRPNGISKVGGGLQNIAAIVVRTEAAENAPTLLAVIDKFAEARLDASERDLLIGFLSRVSAALDRSRAGVAVSRYL